MYVLPCKFSQEFPEFAIRWVCENNSTMNNTRFTYLYHLFSELFDGLWYLHVPETTFLPPRTRAREKKPFSFEKKVFFNKKVNSFILVHEFLQYFPRHTGLVFDWNTRTRMHPHACLCTRTCTHTHRKKDSCNSMARKKIWLEIYKREKYIIPFCR